jgi:phage-related protein
MARSSAATERPVHWVSSSKKDLLAFPGEVVDDFGYALSVVQHGGTPPSAKTWKGEGPGIFELVEEHRGDAFRAVYTVRFEKAIYVLHCFQKKSPSGVHTAKQDVSLIHERLRMAQTDYEVRYGRQKD